MTPDPNLQHISHAVAIKAFDRIADAWQLSTEERCQILSAKRGAYKNWTSGKKIPELSDSQIIIISKVINIYDGLHRLFGDKAYADRWIRCKNAAFGNQQALDLLVSRNDDGLNQVFEWVMDALRI